MHYCRFYGERWHEIDERGGGGGGGSKELMEVGGYMRRGFFGFAGNVKSALAIDKGNTWSLLKRKAKKAFLTSITFAVERYQTLFLCLNSL